MTIEATRDGEGYAATAVAREARPRLTFDLDVDLCVIGGGLAGLTAAREAAEKGLIVTLLEAETVAWNASGRNLGTVMPGFGTDLTELIARVGIDDARELWALSQSGVDYVRMTAQAEPMPGVALQDGALEVSGTDNGDELVGRLQTLSQDFGQDVEGWQAERVRDVLKTLRYFHGIHYPGAFHLHGLNYVRGLAALAERAGVRIFEQTRVLSLDPAGIRKRIVTPQGRVRASQVLIAGNVHLGSLLPRLGATLLPVWRTVAITAPLGDRLRDAMTYTGSVSDSAGHAHYRIVDGDRLMWSGPVATWGVSPGRFAGHMQRQIAAVFPQLGKVETADVWSGVTGETVHGMPQIGELRPGLWLASGFGRQGLNTTAMAAQLVVSGIVDNDDRWRRFSPFELVWSGGRAGRVAGQVFYSWSRGQAEVAGALARYRERARARAQLREARVAAANEAVRNMRVGGPESGPKRGPAARAAGAPDSSD